MNAVLRRTLGFLQGGLNTKVCPGFHGVVLVILPVKRRRICFSFFPGELKKKLETQLTM